MELMTLLVRFLFCSGSVNSPRDPGMAALTFLSSVPFSPVQIDTPFAQHESSKVGSSLVLNCWGASKLSASLSTECGTFVTSRK